MSRAKRILNENGDDYDRIIQREIDDQDSISRNAYGQVIRNIRSALERHPQVAIEVAMSELAEAMSDFDDWEVTSEFAKYTEEDWIQWIREEYDQEGKTFGDVE